MFLVSHFQFHELMKRQIPQNANAKWRFGPTATVKVAAMQQSRTKLNSNRSIEFVNKKQTNLITPPPHPPPPHTHTHTPPHTHTHARNPDSWADLFV